MTAPRKHGNTGNSCAIRHGIKAGKLPKGCLYIERRANALRRQLEAAVIEAKGQVTLIDAATIQTVCEWEKHAALCQRWLRKQGDAMKPSEFLEFSREIAKARDGRNKALAALKLDRDKSQDLLAQLYQRGNAITNGNGKDHDEPA